MRLILASAMRVAITTASLAALLMLGVWTAEAAAPIPPKCSASDTRRHATLRSEGSPAGPSYVRYCGPGRAVLHIAGTTFTVKGGNCTGRGASVGFGLLGHNGLPPRKGFFARLRAQAPWHVRPGRNPIVDGTVQLPGFSSLPNTGTAIVAKDLESATFSLGSPPRITGSWTCG